MPTFITFSTRQRRILIPQARDITLITLIRLESLGYKLHQASIMPDHVHFILQLTKDHAPLEKILHNIKGTTARAINKLEDKKGEFVWERESWDRTIRTDTEYSFTYSYIAFNAVLQDLADHPKDYRWYYSSELKARAAYWQAKALTLSPRPTTV